MNTCVCVCCGCAQSCLILFDHRGYRPPGSSVHGLPRQEYCSGLPYTSPGHLPDTGIEPVSLASPALAGRFFTNEPPGKPYMCT